MLKNQKKQKLWYEKNAAKRQQTFISGTKHQNFPMETRHNYKIIEKT